VWLDRRFRAASTAFSRQRSSQQRVVLLSLARQEISTAIQSPGDGSGRHRILLVDVVRLLDAAARLALRPLGAEIRAHEIRAPRSCPAVPLGLRTVSESSPAQGNVGYCGWPVACSSPKLESAGRGGAERFETLASVHGVPSHRRTPVCGVRSGGNPAVCWSHSGASVCVLSVKELQDQFVTHVAVVPR